VPEVRRILCPIDFSQASQAALDQAAAFCEPVMRVTWGTPYRSIVDVADSEVSDLIVMGIEKHGMLDRLLHGANVPQVIRHATCPVLTLRT